MPSVSPVTVRKLLGCDGAVPGGGRYVPFVVGGDGLQPVRPEHRHRSAASASATFPRPRSQIARDRAARMARSWCPAAVPGWLLACSSISAPASDQRPRTSRRSIRSRARSASWSIQARNAGRSPPASTRKTSELHPAGKVTVASSVPEAPTAGIASRIGRPSIQARNRPEAPIRSRTGAVPADQTRSQA